MKTVSDRFYEDNSMENHPPELCDFQVGDTVKFTNDYGVEFEPHKVIGFTTARHKVGGRFIHINSDSPWFPVAPESLTLISKAKGGLDYANDDASRLLLPDVCSA